MIDLRCLLLVCCCAFVIAAARTSLANETQGSQLDPQVYGDAVTKGINYLKTKGQAKDGSYSNFAGIGPTALITTAVLRHGRTTSDPQVAKSLKYLEAFVREDGGIYQQGTFYKNYETCLAIMCFAEANQDGRYEEVIANADKFVKGIQWTEEEDKDKSNPAYGGGGYGRDKRPDLSNTSFLVDALKLAGNDEDSQAMQRALIFISRCQNLESEHNSTQFGDKVNDGGFYYTPVGEGSSQAGKTPDGGLRSYGAMSYAGLKSMLYAGVGPDDPRVKAALSWVQKHYDVTANPGLGEAGLFYYYHVFAKALDTLDHDIIADADGEKHHWRTELVLELARRQRPDGAWVNKNERWLEGDANLSTGFALLALSHARPKSN